MISNYQANGGSMKSLGAVIMAAMLATGSASAAECFKDLKAVSMFGSDDQVKGIQALAKAKCALGGLQWEANGRRSLLVADFEQGEMLRIKLSATGRSWESWKGFTRDQVLADKAEDGFDLPNFVSSRAGEAPRPSPRLEKAISEAGAQVFLR